MRGPTFAHPVSRRARRTAAALAGASLLALTGTATASASFGFLGALGTYGSGNGQFVDPRGLDAGSDGNLYVADVGNSRIQVVDTTGAFVRAWGSAGSADGQFDRLQDVAVGGSGNVYTAEGQWGGVGRNVVQKFTATGTFVQRIGTQFDFNGIWAIAADGSDNLYVADSGAAIVRKYDAGGTFVTQWGSPGAAIGQFKQLSGIAVDTVGDVYTVEATDGPSPNNLRVQKFGPTGSPKADFVDGGGSPTSAFPIGTSDLSPNPGFPGIDVDAAGNIVLSGYHTLRFTPTGQPVERLTDCSGSGVTAHPDGRFYASSSTGLFVFGEGGRACQGAAPARLVFEGDESLSVNAGAQYTNGPVVQLTIEPAVNATKVRISNDGGFATAATVPVAADRHYTWTLDSSGPERLPKTVYVRFANDAESSSQNFTDDIILDQTAPVIEGATAVPTSTRSVPRALAAPLYLVRLRASDNVSGVAGMQLTSDTAVPGTWLPYAETTSFAAAGRRFFLRVRDGAGNVSAWSTVAADVKAPNTRILRAPAARTRKRTATFRFSSTEARSTFTCKLDKGRYASCRSPKIYRRLKRGKHVFQVRARDRAGNVDRTPAKRTWRVTR